MYNLDEKKFSSNEYIDSIMYVYLRIIFYTVYEYSIFTFKTWISMLKWLPLTSWSFTRFFLKHGCKYVMEMIWKI